MNDETEQLQEQTLKYILLGLMLTGLTVGLTAVWFDGFASPWLLRSGALIVVALIAYALQKAGQFMVAAYVLVLELVGIVMGMFLQPDAASGLVPYLFAPLMIIAGLLLSPAAILGLALFVIIVSLAIVGLTGQLTMTTLLVLLPPFGLMFITTLLVIGIVRYRVKLSGLLLKSRTLTRERTLEMIEAQDKVDSLQKRVIKLQQQVLQFEADRDSAQESTFQKDGQLYGLIQGAIREIDGSVKNLEESIGKVAQTSEPVKRNGFVEETWQRIDRLTTLVVNLEEMVQIEGQKVELNYQQVDVPRLLNELATTTRGLVGPKPIQVRCQVEDDLPPLPADPNRLRQILLPLLNNAVRYTTEGSIDLQAEAHDGEMTIFISDTGQGMSQEEQEIIFNKFEQGIVPLKEGQGAGLGLSISRGLAELHQGRMWCTSVPDIGSTFYVALPLEPVLSPLSEEVSTDDEVTIPSLPLVAPAPQSKPPQVSEPEETFPAFQPLQQPQPAPEPEKVGRPSLPPVSRLSPTYINRFGLSLLGLLIIIAGVVGILAFLNPPLDTTAANGTVTAAESLPTNTPPTEQVIIPSPTPRFTNTPQPVTAAEVEATASPTMPPTETPIQVMIEPTRTPVVDATATTTVSPTETPTLLPPTATPTLLPPPTSTSASPLPTATVSGIGLSAAIPSATVEPTVAPSTRLSFATDDGTVALRNLAAQVESNLALSLETADNSRLAWSPQGETLLFTGQGQGDREIYLTDARGSRLVNLSQTSGDDQQPSWSPDGQKVAFSSGRNGNFDIYVMDIDGSNVTRLTSSRGFEEWPVWSPDGRRIAFLSDRDGGRLDLYVMDADGGNLTRLTADAADEGPATWSPDSRRLVFASERAGSADLYVVAAAGGSPMRLTADPGNEEAPVWSPDGRRIAFIAADKDGADVYTLPAPGSAVTEIPPTAWTQITDTPERESYPVWQP